MPIYEYFCPRCATKFEELRPMRDADRPATCARGHKGATRAISVFAAVTKDADGFVSPMASGGGCACGGGGCGCGH
jgi:putative FmdB family regulatory protein